MKLRYFFCLAAAAMIAACNNQEKTTGAAQDSSATKGTEVKIKDSKIQSAYENYITLKDALVKSNSAAAKEASVKLSSALSQIDGCLTSARLADSISSSKNISEQREHFVALNQDLLPLIKKMPVESGNVFVQYCPMANEGKGAYWLASEKDIKNPYYGDEMLECGEVKEEIKAQ
ncbi:MAG: hypothetical protein K0S09_2636 [Sphingobacteriaceae bacterium]|jgi:hypothetical protein|nr:hypothetical protein [Sphingobacteriaceae bacterium]